MFPAWKREEECRQSSAARSAGVRKRPVRRPRPSGLYATKPMPSSRQAASEPASWSRVKSEYSLCRALIGCTAWARRSVAGEASDSPR